MGSTRVGVVGLGLYIPDNYWTAEYCAELTGGRWTAEAIEEKLGFQRKPVAREWEGTQYMGAKAALDCLKNTGYDPQKIDAILWVGEEWKERPLTTSALYVHREIGARGDCWGVDISTRCCTFITGIKMAKDLMMADPELETVLLCGGYRNNDFMQLTNPRISMLYSIGSGGAAMLLKRGHFENEVLGHHMIVDSSLFHTMGVPMGGTEIPITHENLDHWMNYEITDGDFMKARLNEVSMPNWFACIDRSLEKSGGLTRRDVGYLAVTQFKRSMHLYMLGEYGLTEENSTYLDQYGHVGQMDQVLSMTLGLEAGKIKDGTLISLVGAGGGYIWAAGVIRWGRVKGN
ncbi:MAG: 3-oxoacyl-ACP synthase [Oscillospiraceae bacterium]|nr:3-oxoacyl-ACP synthase [Oscillospiraceae bacterium]